MNLVQQHPFVSSEVETLCARLLDFARSERGGFDL